MRVGARVLQHRHPDPRRPSRDAAVHRRAAWATIQDVARGVDKRLTAADVRLTVGGEPTFVSMDNQVDDEWTTDADGPHKRQRASDLAARLKRSGPRTGWCTAARVAGIPENRCRAGRSGCTGAPTASPCGRMPSCSPTRGTPTQPGPRQPTPPPTTCWPPSPTGWACRPSQVRPAYEDPLSRLAAKARLPEGDPVPGCRPRL